MRGIKFARQLKKLKQKDLAELMEVATQTVKNWEWGSTNIPSDKLLKLSEILGVSCDYLLKGDEKC